jgi:hypothetical protein
MVLNVRVLRDAIACPNNFLSVYFLRLSLDDRKNSHYDTFLLCSEDVLVPGLIQDID